MHKKIKELTLDNKKFYTIGMDRSGLETDFFDRPEGVVNYKNQV